MSDLYLQINNNSLQLNIESMPKVVDIYVLEKKIGNGQFGDVYKGYSKVDGVDVAIKTINRNKVKGKFTELLENQIKVLKSCKNNNIIQLIDIKKTVNNIYLILEFCNEGDLGGYLKQKKKLSEDEAVEYFVQILHAFQTLVKNKIMHRDFKLPNILKHNGVIKIADFGFSKLLGSEDQQVETILGSPLNMAPEVLDKQVYNSKADIWSIGVCLYELIFGKVPFSASNILDLLKKIRKEPLSFPFRVSPLVEDVLRKMLVVNPEKRIDWGDLFEHPVTSYLEDKIEENLRQSMLCDKEELKFNMSKFYIKTNMVIDNPHQINVKQELNNHVKQVIHSQSPTKFKGKAIKREMQRKPKVELQETKGTEKEIKEEEVSEVQLIKQSEKNHIKIASKITLFERNLYAYLGHLTQELLEYNYNVYAECLAFVILKKAISRILFLKKSIQNEELKGIEDWAVFKASSQFEKVQELISQEEQIFSNFYERLAMKVLQKGTLSQFEQDLMISGKFTVEETNRRISVRVMIEYFRRVEKTVKKLSDRELAHFAKLIDSLEVEQVFGEDFNFNGYYDQLKGELSEQTRKVCQIKYHKFIQTK